MVRFVLVVAALALALALAASAEWACPAETTASTIVEALGRGDLECALRLARAAEGAAASLENEVTMAARSMEQRLGEIKKALKAATTVGHTKALNPAYQWAQSGSQLFINVKFAHKLDAPATLVSENDVGALECGAANVTLRAAKGPKRFLLRLDLFRDVVADNCSWSSASVGRGVLTLSKAAAHREWWPRLLKQAKKPPNQHVWWDKQESFEKEQKEVQQEETTRAKEAKKTTTAEEKEQEKGDAAAPVAQEEEAPKTDEGQLGAPILDSTERAAKAEEGAAKKAQARRVAAAKKVGAERTKAAEALARSQRQAANARAKAKVAEVDDALRRRKVLIDADTDRALRDPDFALPTDLPRLDDDDNDDADLLPADARAPGASKTADEL